MNINMRFEPILDRVLVRPDEGQEVSAGGIILTAAKLPNRGTVVAVGPGTPEKSMELEYGDKVVFLEGKGIEVQVDSETLLIMEEKAILGVFR